MNINWIWPADANKITPLQIDRVIIMPYLFPTQIALNIKPVAKRGRVDQEYLKCEDVASIYKTPSRGKIFTPSLLKLLLKPFVRTICVSAENIQPKTLCISLLGIFV